MYLSLHLRTRAVAAVSTHQLEALEADCEELQLYIACEPLAGIAAAVCCLIDCLFERDGETPRETSANLEWSPTYDEIPADLRSGAAEGGEPQCVSNAICTSARFTEVMLDAHYLCTIQNPLNFLLHLPARLLLRLLSANILADIILTLLLKLETYAYMGPPALPGKPPDPFAADEIVQLQVRS